MEKRGGGGRVGSGRGHSTEPLEFPRKGLVGHVVLAVGEGGEGGGGERGSGRLI